MSGITSKHGLKYAGEPMAALVAIANAAKDRSLEVRQSTLSCMHIYTPYIHTRPTNWTPTSVTPSTRQPPPHKPTTPTNQAFDAARAAHGAQLAGDLLVKHHIHIVYDQLLESNLVRGVA